MANVPVLSIKKTTSHALPMRRINPAPPNGHVPWSILAVLLMPSPAKIVARTATNSFIKKILEMEEAKRIEHADTPAFRIAPSESEVQWLAQSLKIPTTIVLPADSSLSPPPKLPERSRLVRLFKIVSGRPSTRMCSFPGCTANAILSLSGEEYHPCVQHLDAYYSLVVAERSEKKIPKRPCALAFLGCPDQPVKGRSCCTDAHRNLLSKIFALEASTGKAVPLDKIRELASADKIVFPVAEEKKDKRPPTAKPMSAMKRTGSRPSSSFAKPTVPKKGRPAKPVKAIFSSLGKDTLAG